MRSGLALVLLLFLAGCSIRPAMPPPLDETLAIHIQTNRLRLVRFQVPLQAEVANILNRQLGWRTSPEGTAELILTPTRDDIDLIARNGDVPLRWRIRMWVGYVLRTKKHPPLNGSLLVTTYASGRLGEPAALDSAASQLARSLAAELEARFPRE